MVYHHTTVDNLFRLWASKDLCYLLTFLSPFFLPSLAILKASNKTYMKRFDGEQFSAWIFHVEFVFDPQAGSTPCS